MFQLPDLGRARAVKLHINSFQHRFQIGRKLRIPEADHAISLVLQPGMPFSIFFSVISFAVMSAIKLNNELSRRTEEINDVWPDGHLPPEMSTERRHFFQRPPEYA